jgi:hypothetical protein
MLPEDFMTDPAELRRWIKRAFEATAKLPPKAAKKKATAKRVTSTKKSAAKAKKKPSR